MKRKMILEQQSEYACMIEKALSLCEAMLSRSEILYPFAVMSVDNEHHCLFLEDEDCDNKHPYGAHFGMIEKLERLLAISKIQSNNAVGMLVYAATIKTPDNIEKDGLMLSICDAQGENTLTLYPYEIAANSIAIGKPFTCDFSD